MSEKTKKPYDWKNESLLKNEVLATSKRRARLATAALILSLGLNIELLSDHAPSKAIFAMLNRDKTLETTTELIDSEIITIDKDETVAEEATQAFKDMAEKNHIDLSDIPFEQIQNASREAQASNNLEAVSYPNDKYITELSKNISGGYEASVEPLQK